MKLFLLVNALFVVVGCSTVYRPVSNVESTFFNKADRTISPLMVKEPGRSLKGLNIAWAGLVKDIEVTQLNKRNSVAHFEVEHRTFNWIYSEGPQSCVYFLGNSGDGAFKSDVIFGNRAGRSFDELKSYFLSKHKVGDMILVYGNPAIKDGKVFIRNAHARTVPKGLFCTGKTLVRLE